YRGSGVWFLLTAVVTTKGTGASGYGHGGYGFAYGHGYGGYGGGYGLGFGGFGHGGFGGYGHGA
ncbi:secreted salivary gland peptide, putative, partial [Ixodes scapularis]